MNAAAPAAAARTMVVGLGATGLSVARHLRRRNEPFTVWDAAPRPAALAQLRAEWPEAPVRSGEPDPAAFRAADTVIVSPGVALDHPALAAARAAGAQVYGDIELFAHEANAPVLGVTGSNGKSTVTRLAAHLLEGLGQRVGCGGNLGPPALSLLREPAPDAYVLELSSFQLEATETLRCRAAAMLNLSPDHLDRHGDLAAYRAAKQRLYRGAELAVYNRGDAHTRPPQASARAVGFGLDAPRRGDDFGVREHAGADWFCQGRRRLRPCAELPLPGRHNRANALAALALVWAHGIEPAAAAAGLAGFAGLPHRLQRVAAPGRIAWYDDSKATNPDALAAALAAFDAPCVLIAGGRAKADDYARVRGALARHARAAVLMGEAAAELARAWDGAAELRVVADMDAAVAAARELAAPAGRVLLSPGCASFDRYAGYAERGDDFARAVRAGSAA